MEDIFDDITTDQDTPTPQTPATPGITYVKGDATRPQTDNNAVIAHVCNDQGRWGAGFVLALSKRWSQPEAQYRAWAKSKELRISKVSDVKHTLFNHVSRQSVMGFGMGNVQFVGTDDDGVVVANMVAQVLSNDERPLYYNFLADCLFQVGLNVAMANQYAEKPWEVHCPRFGAGLAGGDWTVIEALIEDCLVRCHGVNVVVYDFE